MDTKNFNELVAKIRNLPNTSFPNICANDIRNIINVDSDSYDFSVIIKEAYKSIFSTLYENDFSNNNISTSINITDILKKNGYCIDIKNPEEINISDVKEIISAYFRNLGFTIKFTYGDSTLTYDDIIMTISWTKLLTSEY